MKKEALEKIDKIFKIVGESLEGEEKLKNFGFDSYLALVENAKKSEVSRKKVKAFSDRLDSYFSELNKAFQSTDKNYLEFKKSLKELNEQLDTDYKVKSAVDLVECRTEVEKKTKDDDKKKEDEAGKKEDEAEKKENTEEDRSEISKKRALTKAETEWIKDVKTVKKIALSIITIISILAGIMIVATGAPGFWSFVGIVALLDTTVVAMSKILTSNPVLKFIRNAGNAKEGVKKFLKSSLKKGKEKFLGLFKKKEKSKNKKAKKVVSKAKTKVVVSNPKGDSKNDDTIDVIRELAFNNDDEIKKEEQDTIDTLKEFMSSKKNDEESEKEKQDTIDTLKEFMSPQQGEKDSEPEKEESSEDEVAPEKTEVQEDTKKEESVVEQENKSMIPEENKSDEISQTEKPAEKEEPQLEKVSSEEDLPEQKYRKYFGYVLSLKNEISRMERELATKSGEEYEKLAEQIAVKKGIYKSICKDMSRALTGQYRGENVENFDSSKIDQALNKEEYYSSISNERTNAIEKMANKKYNQYLEYALRLRKDLEIMNEELATKYGSVDPEQRVNDPEYLELKYNRNATRNAYLNVSKRLSQMLTDNQEVINQEGKSK